MAGTKFDDSSDPAFEDALLAAAAVAAPPVAAAAAIIDQGEELLEAGNDAAKFVGGALDDIFGGGDDVPPGTSTFPVDPNAPAPSETAEEANARGDDIRANQAHFNELGGGGGWVFNADPDDHAQANPYLNLDTGIAGAGAAGGNAGTAPDGVFEPVSASDLHTSVGGADAGAPDGAYEPVSASEPHTGIGFIPEGADVGAPDDVFEPVSDSAPHTTVGFVPGADDLPTVDGVQTEVPLGSDVQLNPQPIPPGIGADIGEPVADADAAAADVAATSIIIVGGTEAAVGADLGGGADAVSLNPQPIPPGIDLHPPSPIAPADAEVSLNPQPIPPGMGADIGEPVADAAAAAPSTTDSSIIVGGTEAPVLSDVATASAEAPVVADIEVAEVPMEDVASTIAMDDGPLFGAAEEMQAPIEEQVFADDGLDG